MDLNSPTKSGSTSASSADSPKPQRLTPAEAENYGDIWIVGTGDPGDVPVEQVLEALRVAARAGLPAGLDTEYTSDLSKSNYSRAQVRVASIGIPEPGVCRSDRCPVAQRVVVQSGALQHFARWLESSHTKLLYNAPADLHALGSLGLTVSGWQDLLPLSRYLAPDHKDHSLKYHIQRTLGYQGQGEYRDHFFRCKTGVKGQPTKSREAIPLGDIVFGHPLWSTLVRYASLDAKATVELGMKWKLQYGFSW